MAAKIPVGDTINYAFSFAFGNLLTVIGICWLPLGIAFGIFYALFETGWSMISTIPAAHDANNTAAAWGMLSQIFTFYGVMLLGVIAYYFLGGVAAVGITNHALGLKSGSVFVYFAAGAPEWRVFGGYIRYFFACIGIVVIVIVGFMLAGFIGASIGGSGEGANLGLSLGVTAVLGVVLCCLAILTLVRMGYLLVPSIVVEPGVGGLARSYHLTSGNFWRIFVVLLVAALPISIVANVLIAFVVGGAMSGAVIDMVKAAQPGHIDLSMMTDAVKRYLEAFHEALVPMLIIQYVATIFITGLVCSGAAYAYKALTSAPGAVAPVPATA